MVILSATDGQIITDLPIGQGCDGATFNPDTMEAFSSQGDGTLTVIKENSPTSFVVEQTVTTPVRAKTITLDAKTGHLLLITAEYGPPPAPAAPAAAPAPPAPGSPAPAHRWRSWRVRRSRRIPRWRTRRAHGSRLVRNRRRRQIAAGNSGCPISSQSCEAVGHSRVCANHTSNQ